MDVNASTLMASLFVSTVGMGLFVFGKKQTRIPQLLIGMALMGFPYFVPNPVWMLSLGAGLIATLVVAVRLGY